MTTFDKSGRVMSRFIPPPPSDFEKEVDAFFHLYQRHFPDNAYVGRSMGTSFEKMREHLHTSAIILARNLKPGPVRDEAWAGIRTAWTAIVENVRL